MRIEEFYKQYQEIRTICTDSRKVIPNSIFFALKGENFNGNKYAIDSLNKGCLLAVVDEDAGEEDSRLIQVPDVLTFLQDLAHYHRSQFNIPVLAITGTNGKTTTKELITAVLKEKFEVISTKGNLNNHIGVPITLLNINEHTDIAVVEMGANHIGEISRLCEIANPNHGLITNIGRAHLQGFGSPEKVVEAKNELYLHIKDVGGKVFINADDTLLMNLAKGIESIKYGKGEGTHILGNDPEEIFSSVYWKDTIEMISWKRTSTKLVGGYNFYNILAAICVGRFFKVDPDNIQVGLESFNPGMNRSEYHETDNNRVILDAYNANPDSMKAAIDNFRSFEATRKVAILGDMLELGEYSKDAHQDVLINLAKDSFCSVFLVGDEFLAVAKTAGYEAFKGVEDLADYLKSNPLEDSLILLKGSRGIGLESLLSDL